MDQNETKKRWYTVGEFADAIGASTQTVRRWDKEGKVKPHHILPSGQRIYSSEQVDAIINNNSVET
jgi:DNA-binding transcriptional MerR regulator